MHQPCDVALFHFSEKVGPRGVRGFHLAGDGAGARTRLYGFRGLFPSCELPPTTSMPFGALAACVRRQKGRERDEGSQEGGTCSTEPKLRPSGEPFNGLVEAGGLAVRGSAGVGQAAIESWFPHLAVPDLGQTLNLAKPQLPCLYSGNLNDMDSSVSGAARTEPEEVCPVLGSGPDRPLKSDEGA